MNKPFYQKRLAAALLTLLLIFQMMPPAIAAVNAIPIYTQQDLEGISQNLSGNYILMNDIGISGYFEPIGLDDATNFAFKGFRGVLDGNGHVIRNLNFNMESTTKAGIFKINEGTIKNLGIVDGTISGNLESSGITFYGGFITAVNYGRIENCYNTGSIDLSLTSREYATTKVGGIAGMQAMQSTITNCYNTGTIAVNLSGEKTGASIGGIAGEIFEGNGSTITYSYNTGRITGKAVYVTAAGIAGGGSVIERCYNTAAITAVSGSYFNGERALASGITTRGSVSECYNIGAIKGTTNAGGIISADGNVNNCYNAGSVLSSNVAGGIAGFYSDTVGSDVTNCYNIGMVYGKSDSLSRGIGYSDRGGILKNNYYLNASVKHNSEDAGALTDAQMLQKANYGGFDFDRIWTVGSDSGYPFPALKALPPPASDTTDDFAGGNGTVYNPFKISAREHLNNIRNYQNACFIMTNNISFEAADFAPGGEYYNGGNGWIPICKGTIGGNENIFIGTFDGAGYTISNLYVNDRVFGMGGLFGANFGVIKNLGMVNCDINIFSGTGSLGALAGGIAAANDTRAQILNCYSTGKVTASSEGDSTAAAGGICGNSGATIKNCYSTATVTADGNSGGIVGSAFQGGVHMISDCYFAGKATGKTVGGIAGTLSKGGKIVNAVNLGTLTGSFQTGAIVGYLYTSSVSNSYYNNNALKAVAESDSGTITATKYLSPEQLKQKDSFSGFDFNTIWKLDEGMAYPALKGITVVQQPVTIAAPTSSKVLVNGAAKDFDAYTINGNNYFKLRDLAFVLNGTARQFEVTWDSGNNAVNILSSKPYTVVGGEMTKGDGKAKTTDLSDSAINIDGEKANLTAYLIGDNNYFKLRDVMQALDVGVGFDGATNTITIDTSMGYTP